MNLIIEKEKWNEKLIENNWIYEILSFNKIFLKLDIIFQIKWIEMKMKWDEEKKNLNLKRKSL